MASESKADAVAAGGTCAPSCPFCNPWFVAVFMVGLVLLNAGSITLHYAGIVVILAAYLIPLLKKKSVCG